MLGLVLAFSSPVDQSSIREDVKALVKEALGIYLSGQFVSQIHNQAT